MDSVPVTEAGGFRLGDLLSIRAEPFDAQVASIGVRRLTVAWPWRQVDPDSKNSWDGTIGFPRDPDSYDWWNTPWRIEPDPSQLEVGNWCFVGIPPTEARIVSLERYDPPADFGFVPRPEYVMGLVPVDAPDDDEVGFTLYLDGAEPIELDIVKRS